MDRSLRWLLVRRPAVAMCSIAAVSATLAVVATLGCLVIIGETDPDWIVPALVIAVVVSVTVSAPVSRVMLSLMHQLERARAVAEHLASTDPLTGALNRRRFVQLAEDRLASAPDGEPLSLLLFDIDDFKAVNDLHGHQRGDEVLAAVAASCAAVMRPEDLMARWGGEEFVALLLGVGAAEAQHIAGQLRATVAACRVPVSSPTTLRVTVSIGLASARRGETCLDTLLAQADHAMYRAKHAGKNTVVRA